MKTQDDLLFLAGGAPVRRRWWQNRYFWISGLFSACWIVFMIQYLAAAGWSQNYVNMAPAELIGGLGGLALPMVVVWLICAYFDRTDQMETEAKELRSYLNELVYPTEEGAIYTRTLTEALRAQIQEFRTVFQDVNAQTQSVRDDLKKWVRDLSAVIQHVDTKTLESVRQITEHVQNLAEMTELANTQSDKTAALFAEQAATLNRVMTPTVQDTTQLAQALAQEAGDMKALAQEIERTNKQTVQSVAQAGNVMAGLAENSAHIEESINLYESSARQQNARLFANLEKVLSVFRAHGDLLEQEVGKTAAKMAGVEASLKNESAEVLKMAANAVHKADEAGLALGTVKDELREALQGFKQDAGAVVQQIEKAGQSMGHIPVVQQVRTDNLLKEAGGILTRLQDLSVDMAHLFAPKSEEMLWERYYNGDKTVFMRHIKSELSSAQYQKMKDLYQADPAFKKSVDLYMEAFENMTQTMNKADESQLLMSIVIGSDAGRLYMVLANILKGKK